jgi:hypothetical protein
MDIIKIIGVCNHQTDTITCQHCESDICVECTIQKTNTKKFQIYSWELDVCILCEIQFHRDTAIENFFDICAICDCVKMIAKDISHRFKIGKDKYGINLYTFICIDCYTYHKPQLNHIEHTTDYYCSVIDSARKTQDDFIYNNIVIYLIPDISNIIVDYSKYIRKIIKI